MKGSFQFWARKCIAMASMKLLETRYKQIGKHPYVFTCKARRSLLSIEFVTIPDSMTCERVNRRYREINGNM